LKSAFDNSPTRSLSARYFDGRTSRSQDVTLRIDTTKDVLEVFNEATGTLQFDLHACHLRPPLGRTLPVVELPAGASLVLTDPTDYELLRNWVRVNKLETWADRLERQWRTIIVSVAFLLMLMTGFAVWGIPWLARTAAFALPDRAAHAVSTETERVLEAHMLEETTLSEARQAELQTQFHQLLEANGMDPARFDLRFRAAPGVGANALALPSGAIYLLDDLVALAETDEELVAVLAHEAGHVVERHGLQSVFRSTGIFLMTSVILGDVTSLSSLATALPAVLIESRYSKKFETDADLFAAELLLQTGRSAEPLGTMLLRLAGDHSEVPDLIASHPATAKRVAAIRAFSQEFHLANEAEAGTDSPPASGVIADP